MNSEKYIFLPVTQLSSTELTSAMQVCTSAKNAQRFAWFRRYCIPVLAATAVHIVLAIWPAGGEMPNTGARGEQAGVVQLTAMAEPASSAPAAGGEPSLTGEPVEELSPHAPPALADPTFEIASSLRQELGEYVKVHRGSSGASKLPAPTPGLDGAALAALGETWTGGVTTFAPEPPYPPLARQEGREGIVELEVTVRHSGRVAAAVVSRTSGYADLDRAARETVVAKWRFPAGQPGQLFARVSFRLMASERRR